MSYVLTVDQVKKSEISAVNNRELGWLELMENAGKALAEAVAGIEGIMARHITCFCGKGNNGGDGYAAAAELRQMGADVTAVYVEKPSTVSAEAEYKRATEAGVSLISYEDYRKAGEKTDVAIDAIFGTGFKGKVCEPYLSVIRYINESSNFTVSADIPSGLSGDLGEVLSECVESDMTVAFGAYKLCHILPPANAVCGKIVVADIGITQNDIISAGITAETVDDDFIRYAIPRRNKNSHKGTFGTLGAVVGSKKYPGAGIIAVHAAERSGVGLVKAIIPEEMTNIMAVSVPEAVCVARNNQTNVTDILNGCTAAVIGCGMGDTPDTVETVKAILSQSKIPVIIDADGINSLSESIDIIKQSECRTVLTPHPKEAARLLHTNVDEVQKDRLKSAAEISSQTGAVTVLKGSDTVISSEDGKLYVITDGNPGMATAGSGDMLSGMIGAFLAIGLDPLTSALCGVKLHAMSGDMAKEKYSEISMTPSDMICQLPELFKKLGF